MIYRKAMGISLVLRSIIDIDKTYVMRTRHIENKKKKVIGHAECHCAQKEHLGKQRNKPEDTMLTPLKTICIPTSLQRDVDKTSKEMRFTS